MLLDTRRLARIRPYLYHLTAEQNLGPMRQLSELRCARALLESANLGHLAAQRRTAHVALRSGADSLLIRDQKPLAAGAIAFETGWTFERFIAYVNEHVFFWPGDAAGPIKAGLNHYERYRGERLAIVRVPTVDFLPSQPAYSRFNSGAPRCSGGKHSPRGASTYLPAHLFDGNPSQVVEVVAVHSCPLPSSSEFAAAPCGPWQPLHSADPLSRL